MEHKFTCEKCQKVYSSSQSLCNHRRIKHRLPNEAILEASEAILASKKSVSMNNLLICHYCDKKYSHRQSRYKHEKKCLKNTSLIKLYVYNVNHLIDYPYNSYNKHILVDLFPQI